MIGKRHNSLPPKVMSCAACTLLFSTQAPGHRYCVACGCNAARSRRKRRKVKDNLPVLLQGSRMPQERF